MKQLTAIAFVMMGLASGGCKQGIGAHCQVSSDCDKPYTCNQATQTCQGESEMQIDAPPGIDAAPDDAPVSDAPVGDAAHD